MAIALASFAEAGIWFISLTKVGRFWDIADSKVSVILWSVVGHGDMDVCPLGVLVLMRKTLSVGVV